MAVKFFFNEVSIKIPERRRLKQFIKRIFELEGKSLYSLTYIFCTDRYLLSVNQEYLHHDDYTDIISFCLSEPNDSILGDIYISSERVMENALTEGVSINEELHRVVFHGALHLCGYNDKKPADKKRMTLYEDKYLELYFG